MQRSYGVVITDLQGIELTREECELITHPHVGGIILFGRNTQSAEQVQQLCQAIRSVNSTLLITMDQEGGRVQRLTSDVVRLPSMGTIGELYPTLPNAAVDWAYHAGWLMSAELLSLGIDLSFAPVLDLDRKLNTVIGNRAFHIQPHIVSVLANHFMLGMHEAGMSATGKHFPGHGAVVMDSHVSMPVDHRTLDLIYQEDMQPFIQLISAKIDAMMPAHILFPKVDDEPVCFSKKWLQNILRQQLHFSGIVFSDDLNMEGAVMGGVYSERAERALQAGCDMVLMCNNRVGAIQILEQLPRTYRLSAEKYHQLKGKNKLTLSELHQSSIWKMHHQSFIHYGKYHENH